MEAPIQAIRNLGVSFRHVFSCDIDRCARATIEANFPHGKMYTDVTTRDNAAAPYVDVYVAGFPCQPFSLQGTKQGFEDELGRGKIFFDIRDYIEQQKPKIFILENVAGLASINKGEYFQAVLQSLNDLGEYNIHHRILNTKHMGVPQNRRRIYIIGLRKDVDNGSFRFPEPIPSGKLDRFLDKRPIGVRIETALPSSNVAKNNVERALRKLKREGSDPWEESWVVDCDSSPDRASCQQECTPCLTCSRKDGHWVTSRGRRLRKTEMMRLQGMDPTIFKVVVSETQLGKQLGNTMSVNVLERLFCRLLPAVGLTASRSQLPDRWENGEAVRVLMATRGQSFGAGLLPEEQKKMQPWSLVSQDSIQKGDKPRWQGPSLKRRASDESVKSSSSTSKKQRC